MYITQRLQTQSWMGQLSEAQTVSTGERVEWVLCEEKKSVNGYVGSPRLWQRLVVVLISNLYFFNGIDFQLFIVNCSQNQVSSLMCGHVTKLQQITYKQQ
jgi:hypothetical protein